MTDRIFRLRATRDRLNAALDQCESARDLAALSREYRLTLAELDELTPTSEEASAVDEISERRTARAAGTASEGDTERSG